MTDEKIVKAAFNILWDEMQAIAQAPILEVNSQKAQWMKAKARDALVACMHLLDEKNRDKQPEAENPKPQDTEVN